MVHKELNFSKHSSNTYTRNSHNKYSLIATVMGHTMIAIHENVKVQIVAIWRQHSHAVHCAAIPIKCTNAF